MEHSAGPRPALFPDFAQGGHPSPGGTISASAMGSRVVTFGEEPTPAQPDRQ